MVYKRLVKALIFKRGFKFKIKWVLNENQIQILILTFIILDQNVKI